MILVAHELTRRFTEAESSTEILSGLDLRIEANEMVAIIGPSGCGKTTLLSILGALDANYQGSLEIAGQNLASMSDDQRTDFRNQHLGFVFQAFHLLEHLTVKENILVPAWIGASPDLEQKAEFLLERVGLAKRGDSRIPQLSGGERQRVAIARAMLKDPQLLFADEPTGNLDPETGALVLDLFDELRNQSDRNTALVVATHDPNVAKRADRVLRLNQGRLEAGGLA